MPNILRKSRQNLEAAQKLIDNRFFNSSVHCSYYSVFQEMKYILHHCFQVNYSQQNTNQGYKSHEDIYKKILNEGNSQSFKRDFRSRFEFIKRQRVQADYMDCDLFKDVDSIDVKNCSELIIKRLEAEFIRK